VYPIPSVCQHAQPSTPNAEGNPRNQPEISVRRSTAKIADRYSPGGCKPDASEFFIEYTSADDWLPHGFSGGGIWYHTRIPDEPVWRPNLGLAGIATAYFSESRLIRAVAIDAVRQLLNQSRVQDQ
jgi:hypothetical protein